MWRQICIGLCTVAASVLAQGVGEAACPATYFQLSDLPYENYFVSTCNFAATVVALSPNPDSNLTLISPRLIAAFPAGNSGAVAYFAPSNGVNGTLWLRVVNSTGNAIQALPGNPTQGSNGTFGVTGIVEFNDSAVLTVTILGSIRGVRDFVEGPSLLRPVLQNAIQYQNVSNGVNLHRLWLDNVTTMDFGFSPVSNGSITLNNRTVAFSAGQYHFNISYNYTQLIQLNATTLLNTNSQANATSQNALDLSFLTYSTKLLAGTWRFLTYFGRDSMIAMLLLKDKLSNEALEAGIGAVLERSNTTGTLCHEETIGDYATLLNSLNNITSTDPMYDYKMIDTDFYLQSLLAQYFLNTSDTQNRTSSFLSTIATVNPKNAGQSYAELAFRNAFLVMSIAAPFAAKGNQTLDNLVHLREGEIVGEWRDSTYGIGGARIPYDVNTGLVPAALRAIGQLTRAGFYPSYGNWSALADEYAQIWEDQTLQFFEVTVPQAEAQQRLQHYVQQANFSGPTGNVTGDVLYYGLGRDGYNNQSTVLVMNSDDCFRHFLLNTTNQTQLTTFLNQTSNHLNARFPLGLMTDVGMLVANPAYGGDPIYAKNFTTGAYHGTVVWGWPLSMMASGLEKQLLRCNSSDIPSFCNDSKVYGNVKSAYNNLWNSIEANSNLLRTEVWSWVYDNSTGFKYTPLGVLPAPDGGAQTESDIVQLWSLALEFAVLRNQNLKS